MKKFIISNILLATAACVFGAQANDERGNLNLNQSACAFASQFGPIILNDKQLEESPTAGLKDSQKELKEFIKGLKKDFSEPVKGLQEQTKETLEKKEPDFFSDHVKRIAGLAGAVIGGAITYIYGPVVLFWMSYHGGGYFLTQAGVTGVHNLVGATTVAMKISDDISVLALLAGLGTVTGRVGTDVLIKGVESTCNLTKYVGNQIYSAGKSVFNYFRGSSKA
jgi:hypothetical protein